MTSSISQSTLKQYECNWRYWWEYTHARGIDTFNAKSADIIIFLNKCFKDGAKYSTLNTARSAISLISAYDINEDGLIARFFKGVLKERSTKPKYSTARDVTPVLSFMEGMHPLRRLKLKEAAEKVATLLAITTAQRLQTLASINIDNIIKSETGISVKITDQIKTSKPGAWQPELILPFFKETPALCVASAVSDYMDCAQKLRDKNVKNLFLATVKPFGAASSQTIGHWVKTLLGKVGVDTQTFTAYTTRHAAVSTAHKRRVDITVIRRCAGWTPSSQMFFKFYNKPIQCSNEQFAQTILNK
ncbi:uncharacterized protein LOC112494940 [Cephus cinctus]|uniref:Uncharacterized protein LOC112494940 n=1 Tax=Cephus cinctus TaxID=211228 RepID=A0AAJ7RPB5_CEPCN|nr:uncharacterized protein LOC112494940 [Cephus cinctus]